MTIIVVHVYIVHATIHLYVLYTHVHIHVYNTIVYMYNNDQHITYMYTCTVHVYNYWNHEPTSVTRLMNITITLQGVPQNCASGVSTVIKK